MIAARMAGRLGWGGGPATPFSPARLVRRRSAGRRRRSSSSGRACGGRPMIGPRSDRARVLPSAAGVLARTPTLPSSHRPDASGRRRREGWRDSTYARLMARRCREPGLFAGEVLPGLSWIRWAGPSATLIRRWRSGPQSPLGAASPSHLLPHSPSQDRLGRARQLVRFAQLPAAVRWGRSSATLAG